MIKLSQIASYALLFGTNSCVFKKKIFYGAGDPMHGGQMPIPPDPSSTTPVLFINIYQFTNIYSL